MNFTEFFKLIKPSIYWDDLAGFWHCLGCGRDMDKPELELHWQLQRCSLVKMKQERRLRALIIEANAELYSKYLADHTISINEITIASKDKSDEEEEIPLVWYRKQRKNTAALPIDLSSPNGAEVIELPSIPLRKLTPEDLIVKPCVKHQVITGDPIIDSLSMSDE